MIRADLFALILATVALYATVAGGTAERRAAAILITGWILTLLARRPFAVRFTSLEFGILAVDLLMLAAIVVVAATSRRRWPVWMTALQLFSVIAHLVRAMYPATNWRGYQTLLAVNSWLIVALLAIATATRLRSAVAADPSLLTFFGRWVNRARGT